MDVIEDRPRQHPKPVPFCQNALLQPTVPEVSLLLQENLNIHSEKKSDTFSGTDFQTYNTWRWKHLNTNSSKTSFDSKSANKFKSPQDIFPIKDKYATSDIERRKNEILYGESDEPRRPLPPRSSPVVPICIESYFSDSSYEDLKSTTKQKKPVSAITQYEKASLLSHPNDMCYKKESDNSETFCNIISEQNKQMQVLQNQIEQLLKLQEVKDKQIEQLLNSQVSKDKKIEQLLQSLDSKDTEIKEFLKSKERQESYLQDLLKSQENIQKENSNLLKKLNETKHKSLCSIGVMASVQMADASTCTDAVVLKECTNAVNEDISVLRDNSRYDEKEKSLSLHSSDLPEIQENPVSPQSSIHVDIEDFRDSDDDDSENGIASNSFSTQKTQETQVNKPLGHTFYNNVLTQLKDIIHNSGDNENKNKHENPKQSSHPCIDGNVLDENVEAVETFHVFGNAVKNFKRNERFSDNIQNFCHKETNSPSDISLKINALAMKYLKQEQISEFGLQTQIPAPCQHDVTIYNVTNLSFGSLRYLDRYQMLPNTKDNHKLIGNMHKGEQSPGEILRRRKKMTIEENITSVGNILDISSINHQSKLL